MKKLFVLLASLVAMSAVLTPTPAQAHTGTAPHVPVATFDNYLDMTFCKADTVSDVWAFNNRGQEIDAAFTRLPDLHFHETLSNCNPIGHRVNVTQINDPNGEFIWRVHWDPDRDGNPSWARFNLAFFGTPAIAPRYGCRAIERLIGMHMYENDNEVGCMNNNNGSTHISNPEKVAFNSSDYNDSAPSGVERDDGDDGE